MRIAGDDRGRRDKGNPQKELLLTTGQEKAAQFQELTRAAVSRAMRKSVFWARAGQVVKNQRERNLSAVSAGASASSKNLNSHLSRTKMIAMKDVEALLNESQVSRSSCTSGPRRCCQSYFRCCVSAFI